MKDAWALDARSAMLIGVVLVGLVGSQLCVKAGLARAGGVSLEGGRALSSLLRFAREPLLWVGMLLTGVAAVVWFDRARGRGRHRVFSGGAAEPCSADP